jgi:alkaline phosphatase D
MIRQPFNRRAVIGGLGASLAAPAIIRAQTVSDTPFKLGVASGDPSPDGFVIWTRIAPKPLELHSGLRMNKMTVAWEVATDERFAAVVAKGEEIARPELGHSIHAEVAGLQPNRPYWYRFTLGGATSPVGRAKTLPPLGAALDHVRFIAGGCNNYENGYFTAYRRLSEEPDADFFWHYGDYIYEGTGFHKDGAAPTVRNHHADEPYSLDDYRARYAQYKLDPDLQAAHAAMPWWVTWDDHEIDNNWASQYDQDGTPPEIFNLRRQAAAQAYYENMPLRRTSFPQGTAIQVFRNAAYGDLLDCWFLDTRQFRDDQPCDDNLKPVCPQALDPKRTIMGAREEAWLFNGLSKSTRRWNLIANQVMMMPLDRRQGDTDPPLWNMDSWAGYPAARKRLLDHLQAGKINNVVVTTGDEHQNFVGELRARGTEGPALATEFLGTSVSSAGDGIDMSPRNVAILKHNPHCKMINSQRGYVVHDVGRERWDATFKVLDKVSTPDGKLSTRAKFSVARGKPGAQQA